LHAQNVSLTPLKSRNQNDTLACLVHAMAGIDADSRPITARVHTLSDLVRTLTQICTAAREAATMAIRGCA